MVMQRVNHWIAVISYHWFHTAVHYATSRWFNPYRKPLDSDSATVTADIEFWHFSPLDDSTSDKLVKVDFNLGAVKSSSIMELNLLSASPAIVSRIVSNACLGVAWESMLLLTVCTRFCMKTIHLNILLLVRHVLNLFCL